MGDPGLRLILALSMAAMAGVLVWQSFTDRRLYRLIVDTPTSKARGVFIGFNEVVGQASADHHLLTRFSREPCVWHDYAERQQIRKKRANDHRTRTTWLTTGSDRRAVVFDVVDETGTVRVNPIGAQIIGDRLMRGRFRDDQSGVSYPGASRFGGEGATGVFERREDAIRVGSTVYVLGTAHLADDGTTAEIRSEDDLPLIITTQDEARLTRRMRVRSAGTLVGALVCGAIAGGALTATTTFTDAIPGAVLGAAIVTLAHLAHSIVLVYNNLVRLRHREAKAWSLIDVQLARRAELIPQLVTCVSAYTELESQLQEQVASLRSTSSNPGSDLPDSDLPDSDLPSNVTVDDAGRVAASQAQVSRSLIGLAEAHPELKADELFQHLSDQLVDSENRIAAARGFFNDSVTALRDHAQVFPASLVARCAGIGASHHFSLDAGATVDAGRP